MQVLALAARAATRGLVATLLAALLVAQLAAQLAAQRPPLADDAISKDRASRAVALAAGRWAPAPHKLGFFGTIFQLVKDQVNDTKSAYSQISNLVNDQFSDDEAPAAGAAVGAGAGAGAGSEGGNATEAPTKISRADFLKILDRNLKGLRRLRDLEWREAKKDTMANIRAYRLEAQKGKSSR